LACQNAGLSCQARQTAKRTGWPWSGIEDVGVATAFLTHDAARLIIGETLYIDGGYHIID